MTAMQGMLGCRDAGDDARNVRLLQWHAAWFLRPTRGRRTLILVG